MLQIMISISIIKEKAKIKMIHTKALNKTSKYSKVKTTLNLIFYSISQQIPILEINVTVQGGHS